MTSKTNYKYCVVHFCSSNSNWTPGKRFISMPQTPEIRRKWFALAGQDCTDYAEKSHLYFCEDHFDLPNDLENYIQLKVQGDITKLRLRQGCLPSKFDCQPHRKRAATDDGPENPETIKRKRKELIETILAEDAATTKSDSPHDKQVLQPLLISQPKPPEAESFKENMPLEDKAVQVYMCKKYRSKNIQAGSRCSNVATSPIKTLTRNISVSTFDAQLPSKSGTTQKKRNVCLDNEPTSESDVSLYTPSIHDSSSPSLELQNKLTSDGSSSQNEEFLKIDLEIFKREALKHTLDKIKRKPRYYIGIPKKCYFLVNIIAKQHSIPDEHVLLCLKKIRLNTKFTELSDEFGISLNYASKIFCKYVPVIAKALQYFLVTVDDTTEQGLRLNLPIAFRHKYFNVSCIIDCLETEIQKPSKALHQALTWSEYKKANTIKYLISCTPDGLINYISPGYGGRISDVLLVENCDFLDKLKPGACILADRGFKHVEQLLSQKGMKLLRPPSVPSGTKLSKKEVHKTKQIASVRIHIERVIRRVREFAMFKPHSVINTNLLGVADEAISICCALVNLQDSIIK